MLLQRRLWTMWLPLSLCSLLLPPHQTMNSKDRGHLPFLLSTRLGAWHRAQMWEEWIRDWTSLFLAASFFPSD